MLKQKIFYTKTDEAPMLAFYSLLPIIKKMCSVAHIDIEIKDISLAARIISSFSDRLNEKQKIKDDLEELGKLTKDPHVNIIKLPNISASVPQLKAAIKELQLRNYNIPDYPEAPKTEEEKTILSKYSKILGSAVNPVLREGNSDRRVADAVKEYAKSNPHTMGEWSKTSRSHVSHMEEGDFYAEEKSLIIQDETSIRIELVKEDGSILILKEKLNLLPNEIIDASRMKINSFKKFFAEEIEDAKEKDLLISLHMKATMMKVSDPIIFGHAVKVFYEPVFKKYSEELKELGVDPNNGIGDLYSKIEVLPLAKKEEIKNYIQGFYKKTSKVAMVNSEKGITNFHVPSDVIIDASMPAAIRSSGKMWGVDGELQDTKFIIPDRCYAGIYQATIDFCKKNGAFNVTTMGNVANVGLMAKKAEEYGSHDKTFEIKEKGVVRVISSDEKILIEHDVEKGDVWRMCQTKDISVRNWVKLAVARSKESKTPAIFWLDENREHDINIIKKVKEYLKEDDTSDSEIKIMSPFQACEYTLERVRLGQNTISVTGNVLRDYLTDLFPILELGTSAKMLSIVPLLEGGGLFETGAGGTAPKHVEQFQKENHLRWDSLGEFLALSVSLEEFGIKHNNEEAKILSQTLNNANSYFLKEGKSPSRKVKELDNRGAHFYLMMYWAKFLVSQTENISIKEKFSVILKELEENEMKIIQELNSIQGNPVDMGGYYFPDEKRLEKLLRPSQTFNLILNKI